MGRAVAGLVVVWVATCGCSLQQSSTAATSALTQAPAASALDAEVAMPAGFPADFPLYPKARLVAAASFVSTGQVVWGMEWESIDAPARVQAFFARQLGQGDWVLTADPTRNGRFAGAFTRKSNKNVAGTIAVSSTRPLTRILVSLANPS